MKKIIKLFSIFSIISLLSVSFGYIDFTKTVHASDVGFNPNTIISSGEFINKNSMTVSEIQAFLNSMGGMLKDYSEGGRTAAQIIHGAANGHGEASGPPPDGCWGGVCINTSTGTINPKVLLVKLQKEQSLITRTDYSQRALDWAMGYGCPTGGDCNPKYQGFTNQVEWAAWQLRFTYERAQMGSTTYQIGQTYHFYNTYPNPYGGPPSQDVTIGNAATSSLFSYTPHVYNGNRNFWYLYNLWFNVEMYDAQFVSQSPYVTINQGETKTMTISYKNTGSATWHKGTVNLGTVNTNYTHRTTSYPLANNWAGFDRPARLNESSVAPGETGTFTFSIKNNNHSAGNYRLDVGLVADGITWFGKNTHAFWNVNVPNVASSYEAQWAGQSAYPKVNQGETKTMTISYKNTGSTTWRRGVVNLGLVDKNYRWTSNYKLSHNWVSSDRLARLNEATVAPGETGTFTFTIKNPGVDAGNYRLDVGLVADGITWFGKNTHAFWNVHIDPLYRAEFQGQSSYPTIGKNQTVTMNISYKNTGSATWQKFIVNIGTVDTQYNWKLENYPMSYNWRSGNRPATFNESSVAPGETATFTFQILNPGLSAGNYRLDVGLVADGITWFGKNTHAFWNVSAQ